jgi:hypothetical protein
MSTDNDNDSKLKDDADSTSHTRVSIVEVDDQTSSAASSASASITGIAATASAPTSSTDLTAPFHLLKDVTFSKDTNAAMRRYYAKWNIDQNCSMHRWRYNQSVFLSKQICGTK